MTQRQRHICSLTISHPSARHGDQRGVKVQLTTSRCKDTKKSNFGLSCLCKNRTTHLVNSHPFTYFQTPITHSVSKNSMLGRGCDAAVERGVKSIVVVTSVNVTSTHHVDDGWWHSATVERDLHWSVARPQRSRLQVQSTVVTYTWYDMITSSFHSFCCDMEQFVTIAALYTTTEVSYWHFCSRQASQWRHSEQDVLGVR